MQIDLDTLPDDPAVLQQMVRDVVAAGHQQQAALHGAVQEREAECDKLRLLIQRLLRNQFGRRSEQLDPDQLQLGLEDLEQTIGEAEAAQDAAQSEEQRQRRRAARPRRNHGALPAHLPRYEVVVDVEDKACPCCSGALHLIGEDRAEQLDILPARLRVRVTRRPRYGCRACEGSVVQAPAPDRLLDGGMATEALVVHIVVAKFCDHVPLYRQAGMLARQGVTLDRSTLANWVGRACWWLTPLYDLVVGTVLLSLKLFADDTTLPVLDPGRCWILAGAGPRPGGSGAMRSTTGLGAAPRIRPPPTSTRRIAAASVRLGTWPGSVACCRSTAMPGSSGWPGIAQTVRCVWRFGVSGVLLGPYASAILRVFRLDAVAAGGRGARAHPRALRDRGRDPRPPRRTPQTGAPQPKSTHCGRPARLAARSSGPRVGRLRAGESHPLCDPALGWAGGVPR